MGRKLDSLTGLRAILAGFVLLCHGFDRVGWDKDSSWIGAVVSFSGHFGVVGFFVLSGLILTYVYDGRSWTVRDFAINRFARIYPLYLIGILIVLPIDWMSPGFPESGRLEALGLNLSLLQSWFPFANGRFNGPGWTLSVEAFFYASFPLLSILKQRSQSLFHLIFISVLVATILFWQPNEVLAPHRFPALRLWEFMLGMIIGGKLPSILSNGRAYRFQWPLVVSLILMGPICAAWIEHGSFFVFAEWMWMGCTTAALIYLLARMDLSGDLRSPLAGRLWILGGEISYGVYLLHDPIHRYVRVGYERMTGARLGDSSILVKVVYIVGTGLASVIVAYFVWKWIEVPARSFLRGKLSRA